MTISSAILYSDIQAAEFGALVGIAVLPHHMKRVFTQMKLKEKLSSRHAPEKIVWTVEDPFINEDEKRVHGLTFEGIRHWLIDVFRSGEPVDCPICSQRIQRYNRSINAGMVKALEYAATHGPTTPQKMVKVQGGCGDYGKLRFWGFLEKEDDGKWHATEQGKKFLRGEVTGAKYVYVFNDKAFGRSDEQVYVSECFKGFRFSEIMENAPEQQMEGVSA